MFTLLGLTETGGKCQDSENVFALQVVVVPQDLLGGHSRAEQCQYDLDRIPQMAYARFAVADVRVGGDTVEQCLSREAHGLKERSGATTRKEALSKSGASRLAGFNFPTYLLRLEVLLPEVILHCARVS
jgi:hypothetical protein